MNNENKTTNQDITNNLENITRGNTASNQLVFNPATGNFEAVDANQPVSPDATTINSIVKDGFAK